MSRAVITSPALSGRPHRLDSAAMRKVLVLVLCALLLCGDSGCGQQAGPAAVVSVPEGALRGTVTSSRSGRQVHAFLGIPYAKAPLGELRFKPPRPADEWSGVRDATRERSRCPQLSYPERHYEGEEDCLFLNVYTPQLPINQSRGQAVLWDVLVLIHGGGFTFGSGDGAHYGPEHLLDKDMVLVTFNYRLGALGFLATGDAFADGNYGLKDQVQALRWVRRNIDLFGGNPNSVTLFGVQAGGASAHYHMLSRLSAKLFHGVISQSGTALSSWAHVPVGVARRRAFRLGQLLGCHKDELEDSEGLMKCLRKQRCEDIVKESRLVMEWSHDLTFPFAPVVEPALLKVRPFLDDHPEKLIQALAGSQALIPWLIGVASHEGLPQALQMMTFPRMMEALNSDPGKYLPLYLGMPLAPDADAGSIGRRVWDFYLHNDTLNYATLTRLAALTSDYSYFHGVSRSVRLHSQTTEAPVFVYQFTFNPRDQRISLGVPQGDDTRYLFPDTIAGQKVTFEAEHLDMADRLLDLVENFARDGDPTPHEQEAFDNVLWPLAQGRNFHFVDIGSKMHINTEGFYLQRMQFWDSILQLMEPSPSVKDEL